MKINHVKGKKSKKIFLYTLSTCVWCKKTKTFLNELKLEYDYIDVDLLKDEEKNNVTEEMKKWNPACSFPTIIIDNKDCVKGFSPEQIKEKLSL